MRLNLRIIDASSAKVDHVVLVAEAETSMDDVCAALAGPGGEVFVRGSRLDADALAPVMIGLEDRPAAQAQGPATFDVVHGSHLLISGSARSGRSSALRTLAGSLARSIPPSDLHLYGLDFGNGALLPLNDLPHCGGVVAGPETARVERLIARLTEEVARRQELLALSGLGDIAEQRRSAPPGEGLPYVVVLLDRWEGFTAQFSTDTGSELPAAVLRLVRDGAGVGLRLVIAGDRSLLMDRLAAQVEDKLVLRLADRNDYRIANLNPRNIPEDVPPGRAFRSESGLEVQFALLDPDPSGQAQAAALRQVARGADQRWPAAERSNRPFRVDVLPTSIAFEQAWADRPGGRSSTFSTSSTRPRCSWPPSSPPRWGATWSRPAPPSHGEGSTPTARASRWPGCGRSTGGPRPRRARTWPPAGWRWCSCPLVER